MSGLRIFSNGKDSTYNNYYNARCKKECEKKSWAIKPPMTVDQASTSYRYDGEQVPKGCDANDGQLYPYGQYSASRRFNVPPINPPIHPLVEQAVLEYGVNSNFCPPNRLAESHDCDNGVDACLGEIHAIGHSHHDHHGTNAECHEKPLETIQGKCVDSNFQLDMEQLKAYRFKCYECIDPCCPANMLALQMIRETRSNKTGTVNTILTYGPFGTSTTTTTTVNY